MKMKICKPRDHEWDEQEDGVWMCFACMALLVSPKWTVELRRLGKKPRAAKAKQDAPGDGEKAE